jgi:hypothetical protein
MLSFQISALRWGRVSHWREYSNLKKTSTSKDTYPAPSCSTLQNVAGTCSRDWHKSDTDSSGFVHDAEKKNAAPKGLGNGVSLNVKVVNSRCNNTPKNRRNSMSLYAKDGHKRVATMLGYALTLGTEDAWWGLVPVLTARLTEAERVSLAFMALNSLDHDTAYMTASVVLFGVLHGAGMKFRDVRIYPNGTGWLVMAYRRGALHNMGAFDTFDAAMTKAQSVEQTKCNASVSVFNKSFATIVAETMDPAVEKMWEAGQ